MTLRLILTFISVLILSGQSFAQDVLKPREERCAPGYAFDSAKSECIACNRPCDTGRPGVCGRGIVDCSKARPICVSAIKPGERMEVCNGEDDDCDGMIDEGYDKDNDKYTTCSGDCDDRNARIHPDAVERCDGEDNNCNGLIDDGFNIGGICVVGMGECAREGHRRCRKDGLDAECDAIPGEPSSEVCDGKDNDCDGFVDNGLGEISCGVGACKRTIPSCVAGGIPECVPGQPVTELCGDGVDNDCNGKVDDGFEQKGKTCFEGIGGCRKKGQLICSDDGLALICSAEPGNSVEEICGNKIDDDCDGEVDTDVADMGGACDNGLLGECKREGKLICNRKTGKLVCDAPKIKPSRERCDNKDNDCDGVIDNDVKETASCGKGLCIGGSRERVCAAGQWGKWTQCSTANKATTEICGNRIDDDCDGLVDDDAPGLGDTCDNGLIGACFRKGVLKCGGEDGALICSVGPVEPMDEVCNGIDDDCDGTVDEGVTNACNGCGELPGNIGDPCHVPGTDVCGSGIWACREGSAVGMECFLEPKYSNGKQCLPDDNPCTRDICENGRCRHLPEREGLACNDDNPCTTDDMCHRGKCVGGAERSCDDGNPCTADACDPVEGCYYTAIGGGIENACGGCEILKVFPCDTCDVPGKIGSCKKGEYICQQDGSIACVQTVFERMEDCNGLDDDCNGEVDEGFGTTVCGIGACEVTVNNCVDGELKTCVPRDPHPETCTNMGVDDDCNGVIDDVAGLEQDCPVALGTCIVPGNKKCLGDAEFPICVVADASDAEDEDGDGIVNYCDGDSIARGVEVDVGGSLHGIEKAESSSRLYDLSRTRAVMLPWQQVFDSVVIAPDSPDQAMILVSGANEGEGGIAAIRAKDVTRSGMFTFQSCDAVSDELPKYLFTVGDIADVIASTKNGYVRYSKIASQIPSAIASKYRCELKSEKIFIDADRSWTERGRKRSCVVDDVVGIDRCLEHPLVFAGAVKCTIPSGSVWRKDSHGLGVDIVSQQPDGSFLHEFAKLQIGRDQIDDVHISALQSEQAIKVFVTARIGGKRIAAVCSPGAEGWSCWHKGIGKPAGTVAYLGAFDFEGGRGSPFIIASDGLAYRIDVDSEKREVELVDIGRVTKKRVEGAVVALMKFPKQDDRSSMLLVGGKNWIEAAIVKELKGGSIHLRPEGKEGFLPESVTDAVFVGGKFDLRDPHAMSLVPLKDYGGTDLFLTFDLMKGSKKVGEMGFFYLNANEWPTGSVADINFNGRRGSAKLNFEDPTKDQLTYRATIRAKHGGSLDKWIDGFERGRFRFSVKGDPNAVGLWPIVMRIQASDPGGLMTTSRVVLRRDGTVEVISEELGAME